MATSNRERIGTGLEHLAEGLRPFVLERLEATHGDRAPYAVAGSLRVDAQTVREDTFHDVHNLLKIMWDEWNEVFRKVLGRTERSIVSELMDVRNEWAHQKGFSLDDTYRALDSMERLLTAVSSEEAIEVEKHKLEVRRQQSERQAKQVRKEAVEGALRGQPREGLPSWRKVVTPHKDVREGRYQSAEFAADLAQVQRGQGAPEYRDPREFFRRTYITAGLRKLLVTALQRLAGTGGDPVVELQTTFGGGKTHSLLALYHLFSDTPASDLPGVEEILEEAGVKEVPSARTAVLVGTALAPGSPQTKEDGTVVNTLWGEMAWQLGGREAYEIVEQADRTATNPGSSLNELFERYSPCLVLIDEWIAYARQLYGNNGLPGGTFDTHFTFAQTLTEAARAVPQTQVLVSIPASDVNQKEHEQEEDPSMPEVGGEGGRAALKRLRRVVGRMHSPWRSASKDESFSIVRRRLFEEGMDHAGRDTVVEAFMDLYRSQPESFPSACKEGEYERRLRDAYPIHPELLDRLYEDWSTLERFQRTRGVLRLLAAVIYSLWDSDDPSLLILPGSVPIHSQNVKSELTRYLEDNWGPVIDQDVDGEGSVPTLVDRENPALKKVSASRRVARTVYLGSAPIQTASRRGIDDRSIALGCAQPGEAPATFGDALRRLTDRATYLYFDANRYWFAPQPSINRLARDRTDLYRKNADEVIAERLRREQRRRGGFDAVHVAPTSSKEVPDVPEARLVVLDPTASHSAKTAESTAQAEASEILNARGEGPRTHRNALVFLGPDTDRLEDLRNAAAQYLAWKSITEEPVELSLDGFQSNQAKTKCSESDDRIDHLLNEAYCWLLDPMQEEKMGTASWQITRLQGTAPMAERTSRKLENNEGLITKLGGVRLRMELDRVLWRNGYVGVSQLWEDFSKYLYLPRLRDADVLLRAVQEGAGQLTWHEDGFAYAERYDEEKGRFQGLRAGEQVSVSMQGLVVKPDLAQKQLDSERAETVAARGPGAEGGSGTEGGGDLPREVTKPQETKARRFFASKRLDPVRAPRDVGQISEEVLSHLDQLETASVEITLEIKVDIPEGAPESLVRTVTENCNTLKFENHGFERE